MKSRERLATLYSEVDHVLRYRVKFIQGKNFALCIVLFELEIMEKELIGTDESFLEADEEASDENKSDNGVVSDWDSLGNLTPQTKIFLAKVLSKKKSKKSKTVFVKTKGGFDSSSGHKINGNNGKKESYKMNTRGNSSINRVV